AVGGYAEVRVTDRSLEPACEEEGGNGDHQRTEHHEGERGIPGAGNIEKTQHPSRIHHFGQRETEAEEHAAHQRHDTGKGIALLDWSCHAAPHKCRSTKTVSAPVSMKVAVATMERGESRARPQTPWPLVQPLPRRAPKPTSRPPMMSSSGEASSCTTGARLCTTETSITPTGIPTTKARRQYASAFHFCSRDRKSTRLNSSHVKISYADFCLKN